MKSFIILLCTAILMSNLAKAADYEDEMLVKQAFELLNDDKVVPLYHLLVTPEGEKLHVASTQRTNKAFFPVTHIELSKSALDPQRVFYSCRIPGAVIVGMSCVFDKQFFTAGLYSKDVELKGSFRIHTGDGTGEKSIIVENEKNPFSIFLNIAFNADRIATIKEDMSNEEMTAKLLLGIYTVGVVYAEALGKEDYMDEVIMPELEACMEEKNIQVILLSSLLFDTKGSKEKLLGKIVIGGLNDAEDAAAAPEATPAPAGKPSNTVSFAQKMGDAWEWMGNAVESLNWYMVGGIAAGVIVLSILIFVWVYRIVNRNNWAKKLRQTIKRMEDDLRGVKTGIDNKENREHRIAKRLENESSEIKAIGKELIKITEKTESDGKGVRHIGKKTKSLKDSNNKLSKIESNIRGIANAVREIKRWENEITTLNEKEHLKQPVHVFLTPSGVEDGMLDKELEELNEIYVNKSKNLRLLANKVDENMDARHVSESGWALATFCRLITMDCTPQKFKKDMERFQDTAGAAQKQDYDRFQKIIERAKELEPLMKMCQEELNRINIEIAFGKVASWAVEQLKSSTEHTLTLFVREYNSLSTEIKQIKERLEKGILYYAILKDCLPFAYMMQVIGDAQTRFPRFVRQGAIMGMIDFLMKYKDDEYVKPHFEHLIAARAQMIASDDKMSFFEVRAPQSCTPQEYALILKEILRCANPTVAYCDTLELMEIAEKEIPGVMDLLVHYPLRLIDPGNESTEGFYSFEPYRHVMWYQYTPPKDTGTVNRRYHEVLDMTIPNSSGLNIRLFTDPYAAVPVMFHEFCHYMEDPNEASVFARTYAFSLKFYRKYPKANPARDSNFTALYSLLGNPLNPGAVNKLNELIEQYYGKAMSITSAEEKAKQEIGYKNMNILWHNKEEKWCPEVKYPLLNKKEDEANAKMIAEIIIRYAQVPRSIKQQELAGYSSSFMPVANEWYQDWRYWEVEQFNPSVKKNEEREITFYPSWKTFKEWCLQAEHIKKYVDKEYEGKIQEAAGRVIAEKVDEKTSANDIALENLKKLIGENFGKNIE